MKNSFNDSNGVSNCLNYYSPSFMEDYNNCIDKFKGSNMNKPKTISIMQKNISNKAQEITYMSRYKLDYKSPMTKATSDNSSIQCKCSKCNPFYSQEKTKQQIFTYSFSPPKIQKSTTSVSEKLDKVRPKNSLMKFMNNINATSNKDEKLPFQASVLNRNFIEKKAESQEEEDNFSENEKEDGDLLKSSCSLSSLFSYRKDPIYNDIFYRKRPSTVQVEVSNKSIQTDPDSFSMQSKYFFKSQQKLRIYTVSRNLKNNNQNNVHPNVCQHIEIACEDCFKKYQEKSKF